MIPPRFIPPGILQLHQVEPSGERTLLQELPTSGKNRDKLNRMRNDFLMLDSTLNLVLSENNSLR